MSPKESSSFIDESGEFHMKTVYMRGYIGDDGRVHIVSDSSSMRQQLEALDLDRARTLTEAAYFWVRRRVLRGRAGLGAGAVRNATLGCLLSLFSQHGN